MELNIREVYGVKVPTVKEEFTSANIIEVEVGTTGMCGGDTGHGCCTYLSIEGLSHTEMSCRLSGSSCCDTGRVEIMLGGDTELQTFVDALEFALGVLRSSIR